MRISDWSSDVCSSDLADVSFETALRARIKALPEVVSAASSVDWSVRPQGAFTSAIVLTVAYDPRGRTMTGWQGWIPRSEEHTSELQSLMRISYAVFCLKKKKRAKSTHTTACESIQ